MLFYDKLLQIRIDKETLEELKRIAKQEKMPVSVFVRLLIYREINRKKKEARQINTNSLIQ